MRRSRSGPFPHAMWAASIPHDLPVEQYVPFARRDRLFPPIVFYGRVELVAEPEGALPYREPGIDWGFAAFWAGCVGLLAMSVAGIGGLVIGG
jgi:hypothetical protein